MEILRIADELIGENGVEAFLGERGYSLSSIEWMELRASASLRFHNYETATDGTKTHVVRETQLHKPM